MPDARREARKTALYFSVASLLCWFCPLWPSSSVCSRKRRRAVLAFLAQTQTRLSSSGVLGLGTYLLVVGLGLGLARQQSLPASSKTTASASASASASSAASEADVLATQGRMARALDTARQLFAARDKIDAEFAAVHQPVTAMKLSTARKGFDALSDRFAGLDPTYLSRHPTPMPPPAQRSPQLPEC